MERALGLAATSLDRRCVKAVHSVLTDEEAVPGYVHAGFAMTALPHKRIDAPEWVRDGADVRLRIESGKRHDGTVVGIPFGYVARLILTLSPNGSDQDALPRSRAWPVHAQLAEGHGPQ